MIPSRNYACILTVTVYIYNTAYYTVHISELRTKTVYIRAAHVWFVYTLRVTISCTFSGLYNMYYVSCVYSLNMVKYMHCVYIYMHIYKSHAPLVHGWGQTRLGSVWAAPRKKPTVEVLRGHTRT